MYRSNLVSLLHVGSLIYYMSLYATPLVENIESIENDKMNILIIFTIRLCTVIFNDQIIADYNNFRYLIT